MTELKKAGIEYVEGASLRPTKKSRYEIEALATAFASKISYVAGSGDNLVQRISDFYKDRVTFAKHSLADWHQPGSIYVHGEGEFDIITEAFSMNERTNFTIGHELGHYVLHSNEGASPIVAYRAGTGPLEWEANWFSAALLLPQTTFQKIASEQGFDIFNISRIFNVSSSAVQVRLKFFGLIE